MARQLTIFLTALLFCISAKAQILSLEKALQGRRVLATERTDDTRSIQRIGGNYIVRAKIVDGDTIAFEEAFPIYVFKRRADRRKYQKLIANLKIVYPIAKQVNERLTATEIALASMTSKRDHRKYMDQVEAQLKKEYTPVLKNMTYSQGKLLIKLVDRQTSRTSYELVKDLKGSFSAFLWQGVARLFGANLKDKYDKDGDDKMVEQLIILYESGLL